ncbi:MAG: superoxide dismutase [Gemmataceae bacterium]|nr:superoxide dismutase [Gemmataceae bacterium]MCI0740670.1 superoxide dismutase [Gemmataceae bacterium]
MPYTLPNLPYAANALEPTIDTMTMEIHHGRHHKAYVDNLNKALEGQAALANKPIEQLLREINQVPENIRQPVINNGGGHANHSMFWEIMGPKAGGQPTGPLADDIKAAFGDFAQFQAQIKQAGVGRFGSGWAWLVLADGKLKVLNTLNQDSPYMQGQTPIMGIDVWEHAYYLKYQNKRPDYIDAWWNVVNWTAVGERYAKAKSGKL